MTLPRRVLFLVVLTLPLLACGREPAPTEKAPEPRVVRGVDVGTVAAVQVEEAAEVTGTVSSRTTATLSSKIVAKIEAMHVREGSQVEAGQLLVELDDRDITAQVRRAEAGLEEARAALAEAERGLAAAAAARSAAEAQRDLAVATLNRYQRLLERKSVAPQEYDQVLARQKAATADVERAAAEGQVIQARRLQALARIEAAQAEIANAKVMLGYARIMAPWSGVVIAKQADVGSLAAPGSPLLTLEDNRHYRLELAVPDVQAARIQPGQPLRYAIDAAGLAGTARVGEIVPSADPATRTTQARLDLSPSPRLRSGLFGRGWVPLGRRQAVLVPLPAVVERGQLQGVYAVGPDSIARFRLIRTGRTHPEGVEVLSGLAGGERIVVAGNDRVSDGARIENP